MSRTHKLSNRTTNGQFPTVCPNTCCDHLLRPSYFQQHVHFSLGAPSGLNSGIQPQLLELMFFSQPLHGDVPFPGLGTWTAIFQDLALPPGIDVFPLTSYSESTISGPGCLGGHCPGSRLSSCHRCFPINFLFRIDDCWAWAPGRLFL